MPDVGEEISYHIMLLHQAGLIEAIDLGSHNGVCRRPKHLTLRLAPLKANGFIHFTTAISPSYIHEGVYR